MKIGGFWGFTAPMIVLAFPNINDVERLLGTMQDTVNSEIMRDLKIEFQMLSRIRDFTVVDTGIDEGAIFVRKANTSSVRQGKLMTDGTEDPQYAEFVNELTKLLADMIIKGESKGKFVNCDSSVSGMRSSVVAWISDKDFELSETRRVIRGLYKSMLSGTEVSKTDSIVQNFNFRRTLPGSIVVDGSAVEVTESMRRVFEWYLGRLDFIQDVTDRIFEDPMKEEEVWGSSFYDLIKRKPQSLRYLMISKFEPIKTKPSAALIRSTIDGVRGGLELFQKCIQEHVSVHGETEDAKRFNSDMYYQLLEQMENSKGKFFRGLQADDYTVQEIEDLAWIYDRAAGMNVEFLNREFGLGLSTSEWECLAGRMCDLCICGLNLQSLKLFISAVGTTTLATVDNVKKTREELDELECVLDDISSLLSTMRPIGGAL